MSDTKTSQAAAPMSSEAPAELLARRDRIIRELESSANTSSKMAALLTSTQRGTGFDAQVHEEVREAFRQQADEASKNPRQAKVSPILNEATEWMDLYLKSRASNAKGALSADLVSRRGRIIQELESSATSASKTAALLTSTRSGSGFDAKVAEEVREVFHRQASEASKNPEQARMSPILNEAVEWMEAYLRARGAGMKTASPTDMESSRQRILRELESNAKSATKMAALLSRSGSGFDAQVHEEVREAFRQQADEASKNPQQAKVSPILNEAMAWVESSLKARGANPQAAASADQESSRQRLVRELESSAQSSSKMAALLSSTASGSGFDAQVHEEVREDFRRQADEASRNPQQARVSPVLNEAVEWMESYLQSRGVDPKASSLDARRDRIVRELESSAHTSSKMAALLTSTQTGKGFDAKIHQEVREAFSHQVDQASKNPLQAKVSPVLNEAMEWMESYLKVRASNSKASPSAEQTSARERLVRELESSAKSASKIAALLTSTASGKGFDAQVHVEVREAFRQQADEASNHPQQAKVSPILNEAVEWMHDYLKSRGAEFKAASPADMDSRRERIIRELESSARSASKMAALLSSTRPGASFDAQVHQEVRDAFRQQTEEASKNPQQAKVSPILNEAVEFMQDYLSTRGSKG